MNVLRWASKEILEGQLNGRELKVTGTTGAARRQQQHPPAPKQNSRYCR